MEWIATLALVAIAITLACTASNVRDLIELIKGLPKGDAVTVFLCQEDRDLLANYRRRKVKTNVLETK